MIITKYNNQKISDSFINSVIIFIFTFLFIFFIIAMLLSISGLDFITSISGAASSISNVGPGLGDIIGPNGNYKNIPDISKWILSIGMLLGRLELFAILVLFSHHFGEIDYGNYIKNNHLSESFKVYFDKRMIKILLLGAISGFPWVIIGSSLSLWLKEDGLSRSTIGWAGLIFAVYAFNYLWAPIIDRVKIPWLTDKIGHRRGWIVTMQTLILLCLVFWSLINPTTNLALVISIGLIIAIASATQDITVDALRIEQIGENEGKSMQAGAAMAVVGWWTGYKLGGVISLNTAEFFQNSGFDNYWQITFLILRYG